ncbi:transposable element Tcb1 transposase [Trichonephila clavipes]|uniref:Transposable element Tcb1 transposase n=1 Tax=Trichonephila clavipes TaxID=2585209 RepID=A0A8X7BAW2_TRICX|nr:transposable element Tcb1 transposase [Trichonephila clavipes]
MAAMCHNSGSPSGSEREGISEAFGSSPVSLKTIQRELHAANIHSRVAILKPSVSARNAIKRLVVPRPPTLDTTALGTSHLILFPGEQPVYQDDNASIHSSRCVQTRLHEHDEVEHLIWCPQSPDLNI